MDEKETTSNIESQDLQDEELLYSENKSDLIMVKEEIIIKEDPDLPSTFQIAETIDATSLPETGSGHLIGNLIAKHKNNNLTLPQHPVDAFLNAMAPTLKSLSPYDWHLAKSEIFEIVQKYELNMIKGQDEVNE